MNHTWKLCLLLILLLAVMTAIFAFSSQPAAQSQKLSDSLLDRVGKLLGFLPWFREDPGKKIRKLAHFTEFMCLGMVSELFFHELCLAKKNRLSTGTVCSLLFCFLYACSDEIHQIFVPGRSCEWKDVLLDSAGAVIGLAISFLIVFMLDRKAGHAENEDTSA